MGFEVTEGLVDVVTPIFGLHNGIGLLIVAVFMYMRSDATLKLFGVGIGLLALAPLVSWVLIMLNLPDETVRVFGLLNGVLGMAAVVVFFIVGSSDYSPRWQRIALFAALVWCVVLVGLELALDSGGVPSYTDAGYANLQFHAITSVWLMVGLFVAFLEAVHITVEHSHGEPYRSILVAAMSLFAVSRVVWLIAGDNDELRFVNSVVTTAMVLVMWVAVVVHERREIAAERAGAVEGAG